MPYWRYLKDQYTRTLSQPYLVFSVRMIIFLEYNLIALLCHSIALSPYKGSFHLWNDAPIKVFFLVFWPLYGFVDSSAEDVTGNRIRERGSNTQQRAPGWESNPAPLQQGQCLCTWDACSTHWAKQCPLFCLFDVGNGGEFFSSVVVYSLGVSLKVSDVRGIAQK